MLSEEDVIRRLADGEDPWVIDPEHGCTNPLTGYFPTEEVQAELRRREPVLGSADSWRNRFAMQLANAALRFIATEDYERQIESYMAYGLRSLVRDHRDNLDPPPTLEALGLPDWRRHR